MRGGVTWDMSSTAIQGGIPRPLGGGYQTNMMIEPHSPAPAWHHALIKQEPMDQDRNDSGITSGSDFQSSSPGSDNSQDFNQLYPANNLPQTSTYYSTPVLPRVSSLSTTVNTMNFVPLTPPTSEPLPSPKTILSTSPKHFMPSSPKNYLQSASPKPIMLPSTMLTPSAQFLSNNENLCGLKQELSNDVDEDENNTTLTPNCSPNFPLINDESKMSENESTSTDDHLRRLQMSLEKTLSSSSSPKPSEQSNDDDNGDLDYEEYDERGLRIPKMNSHGKVKKYKCKQCEFIAITKMDFWEHTKGHIKIEKMLTCPKCPFVTEYKHHLEYHLRNHFGSKPFKCDKCSYTCVNKSMLNSHMKSHSNVYQYRCQDCNYASKYCHSLKLHLRKYGHKPAMVLNPDGSPNPLPIIDVYGTRRGPKQKHHHSNNNNSNNNNNKEEESQSAPSSSQVPNIAQLMMTTPTQFPLTFPYPFLGGFPTAAAALNNQLFFQNLTNNKMNSKDDSSDYGEDDGRSFSSQNDSDDDKLSIKEDSVLDLSKHDAGADCSNSSEQPKNSRRKGKAIKLDKMELDGSEDDDLEKTDVSNKDDESTKNGTSSQDLNSKDLSSKDLRSKDLSSKNLSSRDGSSKVSTSTKETKQQDPELRRQQPEEEVTNNNNNNNNNKSPDFNCQFCDIAFGDIVLYTMHMGYHGYKDPFTCNMCGEQCNDKVSFFLHIARTSHS